MNSKATAALVILALLILLPSSGSAAFWKKKQQDPQLNITLDESTQRLVVSWKGPGVLKRAAHLSGRYQPVTKRAGLKINTYVTGITEDSAVYRLEGGGGGGPVYSVNAVGYVNLYLPPGLSLICNPLIYTNNILEALFPVAPDGAQVYKLTAGGGYEVSTFNGFEGTWSYPDMDLSVGVGFYFNNPSAETFQHTFVGEVAQGHLVNPLPAGISTKGSLVPQGGSINSLLKIPGEPGDELRLYMNDLQGGGAYDVSVFTSGSGWVPDLELRVGQGFWIEKQNPQDWVRNFTVN